MMIDTRVAEIFEGQRFQAICRSCRSSEPRSTSARISSREKGVIVLVLLPARA